MNVVVYFIIIGIMDAVVFTADKYAARQGGRRVPEIVLHLLEVIGGVFLVVPMMYILHHKCSKFSYYAITYLILLMWLVALYIVFIHN